MDNFELLDIITMQQRLGERYLEFFRADSMSLGLYVLNVDETDPQQPHTEDEIYYVASGRARLQVGEEERDVQPGSIVFVGAGVDHRFHSITETLTLLVIFAPARGSQA